MAAKKKTRKKQTKSKRSLGRKSARTRKSARKAATLKKKPAASKSAKRKAPAKAKALAKKTTRAKTASAPKRRSRSSMPEGAAFLPKTRQARRGALSGDLQGLSDIERAGSESVNELLEEGNAFEAGIVTGVEEAETADGKEVRTHEVPEDDVPGEYLDKD